MGYPFDKTWTSRAKDSHTSVRDIVANKPHIKLYDFKIKRQTQNYEGNLDNLPPSDITWEKNISKFFIKDEVEKMIEHTTDKRPDGLGVLDLSSKKSVVEWASIIYYEISSGDMPDAYNEQEKEQKEKYWSDGKRAAAFKEWMLHGYN